MDKPINIILVGFMGSGKTTTGKELARFLGYGFMDLDLMVEEACGMNVQQIFKDKGEKYFREKESAAIELIRGKKNQIVSTGGGVWQNPENRRKLMETGFCIWLKVSPEKALERIESHLAQRPLLASSTNPLKTTAHLLMEREIDYSKAPMMVNTDDKTPKQVTREIVDRLKKEKSFDLRTMQE